MLFRPSGHGHGPETIILDFGPTHKREQPNRFPKKHYCGKSQNLENRSFGKDACLKILEISSYKFLEILNMESISSRKHELEILFVQLNELKHSDTIFIFN